MLICCSSSTTPYCLFLPWSIRTKTTYWECEQGMLFLSGYIFPLLPLSLCFSLALSLWLFLLIPQMWKCVHIIYIYPVSGQFVRAGLLLALSLLIFKGQFIWTIVFKLPQKDWIWIDIWLRRHFSFQLFSLGAFKQNTVHFGQSLLLFYCIFLNSGKESVLSLVCILQHPVWWALTWRSRGQCGHSKVPREGLSSDLCLWFPISYRTILGSKMKICPHQMFEYGGRGAAIATTGELQSRVSSLEVHFNLKVICSLTLDCE